MLRLLVSWMLTNLLLLSKKKFLRASQLVVLKKKNNSLTLEVILYFWVLMVLKKGMWDGFTFPITEKIEAFLSLQKDTFWFSPQDIASNIKNGTPELNGLYTYLSLGFDSDAVEITRKIAKKFGGYLDEQDTDNIPYKKVE